MLLAEVVRVAVMSALDIIERELSGHDERKEATRMAAEQLRQRQLLRTEAQEMLDARRGKR